MVLLGLAMAGGALYIGMKVNHKRQKKKLAPFLRGPQHSQNTPTIPPWLVSGDIAATTDKATVSTSLIPQVQDTQEAQSAVTRKRFTTYIVPASLLLAGIGLGGYIWLAGPIGVNPLVVTNQFIAFLRTSRYTPLLYTLAYTVRPLVLFPASLLTIAGGLLFGPVWGTIYTIAGSNASALVAYGIGRYFGQRVLQKEQSKNVIERYGERMRQNPFATVLVAHSMFLPYDLVNYVAGFLRIAWQPFLLATALGALPGTMTFVLAGSSVEGNTVHGIPRLRPATLAASGAILVGSLALARYLKKHERAILTPSDQAQTNGGSNDDEDVESRQTGGTMTVGRP